MLWTYALDIEQSCVTSSSCQAIYWISFEGTYVKFSGRWFTSFGPMELTQEGDCVRGF
jgi:hypothetical protein